MNSTQRTIATADCETNPFNNGLPVIPFVWGLYDGTTYHHFEDNPRRGQVATDLFLAFLEAYPTPLTIYAHNGGKFDWLFIAGNLRGNIRIIGSRLVRAELGKHELRDSFANIPVPLRDFGDKRKIDYNCMLPENRTKPAIRALIKDYLTQDCVGLYDAMVRYRAMFGDTLTMPSAAMNKLNEICTGNANEKIYQQMDAKTDNKFRPFYYGGRVQCFERGIIHGDFKVYDVTSMYPSVMRNCAHPISSTFVTRTGSNATLTDTTDFAIVNAECHKFGSLPQRSKAGLSFPTGRHTFLASGAELRTACELGILTIYEIERTYTATDRVCFGSFVDTYFNLRQEATRNADYVLRLFYKLVLNSAYGKLAIQPDKYEDTCLLPDGERPTGDVYYSDEIQSLKCEKDNAEIKTDVSCLCNHCTRKKYSWRQSLFLPGITMWVRPILHSEKSLANVAAGASITAHARASLLRGIHQSTRPIYCDTDSLICEGLAENLHGNDLGQWKLEAKCTVAAIAGKKLYALFDANGNCVKQASKGVQLDASDIRRVAEGQTVRYTQAAPVIKRNGVQLPLSRNIVRR